SCGDIQSTLILQYDDSGVNLDCSKTTSQIVIPVNLLSAFNGQNPQGTWTFRVRDAVTGKFGTINSASLNVCNQTYTLGNPDVENVAFILYPNPNKGNFTIQFKSDSINRVHIYVHDALGKKVYSNSFDSTDYFNQNIQLSNVSSGIYLVTVIDGDRRTVKKIIVN
ncbi:propanediol utilization protein, partial [Flavobacterium sp. HMWF030]